jgi:DNA-directed RNA polymerase subunit L
MKPSIDHVAVKEVRELIREVETAADPEDVLIAKTQKLLDILQQLIEELKQL